MSSSNVLPTIQFSKILFEGVYATGSAKVVSIDKTETRGNVDGSAIVLVKITEPGEKRSENEMAADIIIGAMIRDLNDQPDVVGHRFGVVELLDAGQTMFPSAAQPDQWFVVLNFYGEAFGEEVEQFRYGWWFDLCKESPRQLSLAL